MKMSRPKNSGAGKHRLAALANGLHHLALKLSHEIINELSHLNSARLGKAELSQLAPRERAQAVKAALATHHEGSSRCC